MSRLSKTDIVDKLDEINESNDSSYELESWGESKYRLFENEHDDGITPVGPVCNGSKEMYLLLRGMEEGWHRARTR